MVGLCKWDLGDDSCEDVFDIHSMVHGLSMLFEVLLVWCAVQGIVWVVLVTFESKTKKAYRIKPKQLTKRHVLAPS